MERSNTLPIGTIIQGTQYRIDEVLGQGSFGITYKISDPILNRVYALKEFFPLNIADRDTSVSLMLNTHSNNSKQFEDLKKKFIDEARALADCNHPGIVKIHDILTPDANTIYYRMDYIEGVTLNKRYEKHPMNLQDAIAMVLKIAEPLKYIHSKKIAHFDLNPNNVMLRRDGSVVLIDFGFAKRYDSNGNQKTSLLLAGGTPGYIAPDQLRGIIETFTPSADIYALGGIFYFLLTGQNPPNCMDLVQDWGLLLSKLPKETHSFFEKAMSISVKNRFQSVSDFCNALVKLNDTKIQYANHTAIKSEDKVANSYIVRQNVQVKGSNGNNRAIERKGNNKNIKKIFILLSAIVIVSIVIASIYNSVKKENDSDDFPSNTLVEANITGDSDDMPLDNPTDNLKGSGVNTAEEKGRYQPEQVHEKAKENTVEKELREDQPKKEDSKPTLTKLDLPKEADGEVTNSAELGKSYLNKDNRKAFEYFLQGANNGDTEAMFQLGECYYKAIGIDRRDENQALYWWSKAAKNGHQKAIERCKEQEVLQK